MMAEGRDSARGRRHSLPQIRRELAATLRLAAPIVVTQLAWVAMLTTDTAMIGRLGTAALAGASIGQMSYFALFVFCMGIVTATAGLAAQAFGARQARQVRRVVRQGLWATILLTVPASSLLLLATDDFLLAIGQPADAVGHAQIYVGTLAYSLTPAIAFMVLRNFVAALGRPMVALWVMLAGVPMNALLDYTLIFGNFGFPPLGLAGAGIATTAVNAAMLAGLLAIVLRHRAFRRYAILGRFWRPDWHAFRQIFRIGLPIAGIMAMESFFFIGATFMMGWIDTRSVAAHMIAMQIPHITFMIPMGLAQAATVRVGHAVGRRDAAAAYRAGWTAIALALAFMAAMSLLILAIPTSLAGLFLDGAREDSAAVLALAVAFLFYAALFQVGDGIQAVAAGALRGLNDTAMPMVVGAISYWGVGLAFCLTLGFATDMGGAGIWLGFVFGLGSAAALLTWRFRRLAVSRYLPPVSAAGRREP